MIAVIALFALVGLGLDAMFEPVEAPAEKLVSDRHVERGTFCPPPVGDSIRTQAAIATASGAGVPIDFQDASLTTSDEPPQPKSSTVREGAFLLHNSDSSALTTIGFGDRPIAGALHSWSSPATGAGAALCSERPSGTWYFPVGTSELRFGERLLLFNPYPDEGVAQVTFYNETGAFTPASLTDVAVPSGGWEEVSVNEFVKTEKLLSARVETVRGRLIAWRVIFAKPEEGAKGASFTLGAPESAPTWYFPHGLVGGGATQKFTIINPTDEEADVSIQTFSSSLDFEKAVDLTEVRLEPQTSREINLASADPIIDGEGPAHLSATVSTCRPTNPDCEGGTPIIVERSLEVESGIYEGISAEVGVTETGSRWLVPPVANTSKDDSLGLFNPGRDAARIDVTLYTLNGPQKPGALTGLSVEPGRRLEKSLDEYSKFGPFYAVVESSAPIAVERLARSVGGGDVVDVMGRVLSAD